MSGPSSGIVSQPYALLESSTEEIRLITIEATENTHAELRCHGEAVKLSSCPPYDALSYVWGDANITQPIKLNGCSVQVTTNLYQALIRLRARTGTSRLWIDALCINQSSVEEKSNQIPLMGKIYSQAKKALIWVGEEDGDSTAAMAFVRRWGIGISRTLDQPLDDLWLNALETTLQFVEDPFNEREIKAFGAFLSKDYWRRVWIIQEVVLSRDRTLICGAAEISYENFYTMHHFFSELLELNKNDTVDLKTMKIIYNYIGEQFLTVNTALATIRWLLVTRQDAASRGKEFRPDAFMLAARTRSCLATDMRDNIYGLLGLISSDELGIEPSYAMDVNKVYTHFTRRVIECSVSLRIICLAGIGAFEDGTNPSLPSWVPDFSREPDTTSLAAVDTANNQVFRAAKERRDCSYGYIPGMQPQLFAQGIICDDIVDFRQRDASGYSWLWSWLKLCMENCPPLHPAGMPIRQAFFRNLIHEASGFGYGRADFSGREEEASFFGRASGFMTLMRRIALERIVPLIRAAVQHSGQHMSLSLETDVTQILNFATLLEDKAIDFETFYWLCNSSVTHDAELRSKLLSGFIGAHDATNRLSWPDGEYAKSSSTNGFIDFAATIVKIRSFVVTGRGYMGTAPWHIEKGDLICILLGCPVPLVVRRKGPRFVVVGEAYVYGMMHGEMMDELESRERVSGGLNLQTLVFE